MFSARTPVAYHSPVELRFWVVTRHWSSHRIRSRCTVRIFRYMTRFVLIFWRRAIWISILRSRMCLSPFSNPHQGFCMDFLPDVLADSPPPDVPRPISVSPVEVVSDLPDCLTRHAGRRSPDLVPRWRLAREGPFLAECSSSLLRCFGDGCFVSQHDISSLGLIIIIIIFIFKNFYNKQYIQYNIFLIHISLEV